VTLIVAIEGLDASGKTTQARLLADALQARHLRVAQWSFPRYESFFGRRIRTLLDGSESTTADTLDPTSMALWFAMDRWDAVRAGVPEADVLILNRWILSNAVYQGARVERADGSQVFDWVIELETQVLGLPQPDVSLVLELSVEESMDRARARAAALGTAPDVYESHALLLRRSAELYDRAVSLRLATAIDGEGGVEAVHQHLLSIVTRTLPTSGN
jgi:dTMP kinase